MLGYTLIALPQLSCKAFESFCHFQGRDGVNSDQHIFLSVGSNGECNFETK
jgi:hypothetical protein